MGLKLNIHHSILNKHNIHNLTLTNGKSGNSGAIESSGNLTVSNLYLPITTHQIMLDGPFIVMKPYCKQQYIRKQQPDQLDLQLHGVIQLYTIVNSQKISRGDGGGAVHNEGESTISNTILKTILAIFMEISGIQVV